MRTLILNSSNIIAGSNNSALIYRFPSGSITLHKGQKLALASLTMYYSTFNITASQNNNAFNYVWVDGSVNQVLFPDGFYDASAINNFLHFTMVQNRHFLVDALGNFVYFITITTNPSAYALEVNNFVMSAPLALASAWVLPSGATWVIPTNNIVPVLQILANAFRDIVGFSTGYYPTGSPTFAIANIAGVPPAQVQTPTYTTTQTFLSSTIPQITPLSSYILTCNLINNNYAVPNNLMYCFSPQGAFGSQFTIAPSGQLSFINIQEGQYDRFVVAFTDQLNQPVKIQDPNIAILLIITDADDDTTKKVR